MATNHEVEEKALDELGKANVELARARARVNQLRVEALQANPERAWGFCHCGGFFRGSDHCQCCGCEEFEGVCSHVCDMVGCSVEHDEKGRYV